MGKKVQEKQQPAQQVKAHPNSKATRFDKPSIDVSDKQTWPSDAVVYIGHLPHGFLEQQIKQYFSQYGEVLGVKVARSRTTARSKGFAFIQFKYPQVANIVSDTMNGYLLLGKVLVSNTLPATHKNPFHFATSKKYTFINWKRQFILKNNQPKTKEQTANIIHNLLVKEQKKREKLKEIGIEYDYPGFSSHVPKQKRHTPVEKKQKPKSK